MPSAAKAKLGTLYIDAREAAYIQIILYKLGHKEPKTPIQTGNSTDEGVINRKIQPKRITSVGMRFYWLRDRASQFFSNGSQGEQNTRITGQKRT